MTGSTSEADDLCQEAIARALSRSDQLRDNEAAGAHDASYSRDTVSGWFRVFRTMTRDAMAALELQGDLTLRIMLPEDNGELEGTNSLSPAQLSGFRRNPMEDQSDH